MYCNNIVMPWRKSARALQRYMRVVQNIVVLVVKSREKPSNAERLTVD